MGTVVAGMGDGIDDIAVIQISIAIRSFERHHGAASSDTGNADAVVGNTGGNAGTGGAMTFGTVGPTSRIIHGVGIVIPVIVACHQSEVWMGGIHSTIDDGNDDI